MITVLIAAANPQLAEKTKVVIAMDWINYIRGWLVWFRDLFDIIVSAVDALVRHFGAAKSLIGQPA